MGVDLRLQEVAGTNVYDERRKESEEILLQTEVSCMPARSKPFHASDHLFHRIRPSISKKCLKESMIDLPNLM